MTPERVAAKKIARVSTNSVARALKETAQTKDISNEALLTKLPSLDSVSDLGESLKLGCDCTLEQR